MSQTAPSPPLARWLEPRPQGPGAPPAAVSVGTMNFGARTPAPEARRIVSRALERGVPFFDTANSYGNGEAERLLGQALRGRRAEVGLATKVGLARVRGKPEGLSAGQVVRAVEDSLKRLGTDYVDVLYLHAPDPATPVEETLEAVHGLLRAGKARHWGVSNHAAWQLLELRGLCDARGMPRPALSQVLYNVLVRQVEVEYLPFTRRYPAPHHRLQPAGRRTALRAPCAGRAHPHGLALRRQPLLPAPLLVRAPPRAGRAPAGGGGGGGPHAGGARLRVAGEPARGGLGAGGPGDGGAPGRGAGRLREAAAPGGGHARGRAVTGSGWARTPRTRGEHVGGGCGELRYRRAAGALRRARLRAPGPAARAPRAWRRCASARTI